MLLLEEESFIFYPSIHWTIFRNPNSSCVFEAWGGRIGAIALSKIPPQNLTWAKLQAIRYCDAMPKLKNWEWYAGRETVLREETSPCSLNGCYHCPSGGGTTQVLWGDIDLSRSQGVASPCEKVLQVLFQMKEFGMVCTMHSLIVILWVKQCLL